MKDRRDEGLWAWKQRENHNRMIDAQAGNRPGALDGDVKGKQLGLVSA